jgi:chaperone required for assembly of F1-ATPase
MKRIWSDATAVALDGGGFGILLDDKPLKKPSGAPLAVPFAPLANAIAAEWGNAGAGGRDIIPDHLPFTRLATTAIDRIAPHRDAIIPQLAAYALHDLLCYRASSPPGLVARQSESWDVWLRRAAGEFGVALNTTTGVTPIDQPPETRGVFTAALAGKTDFELAGLGVAIPALGSIILGLALLGGALGAAEAFQCASVDELFQAERWGDDAEAKARRDTVLNDLIVCETFWAACR